MPGADVSPAVLSPALSGEYFDGDEEDITASCNALLGRLAALEYKRPSRYTSVRPYSRPVVPLHSSFSEWYLRRRAQSDVNTSVGRYLPHPDESRTPLPRPGPPPAHAAALQDLHHQRRTMMDHLVGRQDAVAQTFRRLHSDMDDTDREVDLFRSNLRLGQRKQVKYRVLTDPVDFVGYLRKYSMNDF